MYWFVLHYRLIQFKLFLTSGQEGTTVSVTAEVTTHYFSQITETQLSCFYILMQALWNVMCLCDTAWSRHGTTDVPTRFQSSVTGGTASPTSISLCPYSSVISLVLFLPLHSVCSLFLVCTGFCCSDPFFPIGNGMQVGVIEDQSVRLTS